MHQRKTHLRNDDDGRADCMPFVRKADDVLIFQDHHLYYTCGV